MNLGHCGSFLVKTEGEWKEKEIVEDLLYVGSTCLISFDLHNNITGGYYYSHLVPHSY